MKKFLVIAILFMGAGVSHTIAQTAALDLPESSVIPHYRLYITYNTTTVLIFPASVKPVDRGDKDVIAQKQPGVENVLKLKAGRRGFPPTNLHVFTSDGGLFAFDVYYTDSLATTHNLIGLMPINRVPNAPMVYFSNLLPNTEQLARYVSEVKARSAVHIAIDRRNRMKLSLQYIGMADNLLFLRLKLTNLSVLDYSVDFVRLYIRDREKAKRSSVQEQEIVPLYEDTAGVVLGTHSLTHVVAVPVFTLANNKEFLIEVYEKNGGRSLSLRISNRDLFKLRKL